ncbi:transcriptional activator of glycolytic enzymes-domain-containing protein [Xylariales sp. PMI_506]|nr:transcriptional activator of glycolytic enzymes-domain-containing protein [Xylariales sp. PMI_506]
MDHPNHPLFEDPIFQSIEFLEFAVRIREICKSEGEDKDTDIEAIETTSPVATENLREITNHQLDNDPLTVRHYEELMREVNSLKNTVKAITSSWIFDLTPNKMRWAQRFEDNADAGPPQSSSSQAIAPSFIQELESSPLAPPGVSIPGRPPLYRLPRDIKTIVDLMKLWREGVGSMPTVETLEQRWGSRWRPPSDKAFYSTRKVIVDEVKQRASTSGRTLHEVAEQMDREKGSASLDKVMKIIRSQRKQPIEHTQYM